LAAAIEPLMVTQAAAELEEVFRAHHARVLKAAYRVTGSVSDAEDVAQSVFLRLARTGIDRSRITYLEGYLHRAAVNGALDLIRSRGNREDVPLEDEVVPFSNSPVSPERTHSSLEIRNWLRGALAELSPRTAEMFVLRYIEGMDNPEIAKAMNTSQAVVAVTLHRVRAKLKKELRGFMRGAS
jgi:RNA polymerase sigma factor (sigma-70 family)